MTLLLGFVKQPLDNIVETVAGALSTTQPLPRIRGDLDGGLFSFVGHCRVVGSRPYCKCGTTDSYSNSYGYSSYRGGV